jgi:hypothetical protein
MQEETDQKGEAGRRPVQTGKRGHTLRQTEGTGHVQRLTFTHHLKKIYLRNKVQRNTEYKYLLTACRSDNDTITHYWLVVKIPSRLLRCQPN